MMVISPMPGTIGFDTDTILDAGKASAFRVAGFGFAVRYLSRTSPQASGDLHEPEIAAILGAGLGLMAVQHCDRQGWSPSAQLGQRYAEAAMANAKAIGLPTGINLWLDLEGPLLCTPPEYVIDFINFWAGIVFTAGYIPGLYVGFDEILTSAQLYQRLRLRHYWKSASAVPDVAFRGYQMVQTLAPSPLDGVSVDRDVVMADAFGGLPLMAAQ